MILKKLFKFRIWQEVSANIKFGIHCHLLRRSPGLNTMHHNALKCNPYPHHPPVQLSSNEKLCLWSNLAFAPSFVVLFSGSIRELRQ